ncbi:MAG: hypothetical protein ACI3Z0_05335 [Candidatus Cryptobacteroides sp.]
MPKFLQPIDLNGLEVQNAALQNLAAAPTTKLNLGRIYYDTADGKVKVYAHLSTGDKFCIIPWTEDLESFLKSNGLDSNGYEVFVDSKGGTVTVPGKTIFDNLKEDVEAVIDTTSNKVKLTALPDTILGQMMFGGTVNASNVATLSAAFKSKYGVSSSTLTLTAALATTYEGVYFIATGATTLVTSANTGDWIVSNGSEWTKIDNTDAVTSVAGYTGAITAAQLKTALGLKGAAYMEASAFLTALSSNTTNAVSITVGGTTKTIPVATMKTSLGLKSMAYQDSTNYSTTSEVNNLISNAITTLQATLIGTESDDVDADTINGVRNYVDSKSDSIIASGVGYEILTITGNGTDTSFTFSKSGRQVLSVMVMEGGIDGDIVYPDIRITSTSDGRNFSDMLRISFATAPANGTTYGVRVTYTKIAV